MEQASEKNSLQSVAIDGGKIRNLRELKKLTQVYGATVVGVTTDTISRGANNRTPTIRRDNAEKLAQALEVDLEEILRTEPPAPTDEPGASLPATSRVRRRPLLRAALIVIVLGFGAWYVYPLLSPHAEAHRWLPRFAAPGSVMPVQVKIVRKGGGAAFIIKERLPDRWRLVAAIPQPAPRDPATSEVKWLIPAGKGPVTVSYTVRLPAGIPPTGVARFQGELVLRSSGVNRSFAVGGDTQVRIGPYHWADSNGDGRIDDDEVIPAYYLCQDLKGLGLDWPTIEAIWSGKGYRWAPKTGFTVVK